MLPSSVLNGNRSLLRLSLALLFLATLAGCGGGSSSNNKVASLQIFGASDTTNALTAQSITAGQVFTLTTQAKNPKGTIIVPKTVTWSSNNNAIASVSTNGEVCGGTWDASFVTCTPGQSGTATITATADGQTATASITVHPRITSVSVAPATVQACFSQTQTVQLTAKVFSDTTDITAQAGTIGYSSSDPLVATVDANGVATAKGPGATNLTARVGGVTSAPALFIGCPPKSITVHLSGDAAGTTTTDFNLNVGDTKTLATDVVDTQGNPITGLTLTYSSNAPTVLGVSATTLTAAKVGFGSAVASCLPPSCNPATGLTVSAGSGVGVPVYSNLVTAHVAGTPTNTTVYVTGATAADGTATNTSLLPIDTTNNTAGTAITLPAVPNSMMMSPKGDLLYVGTANGLALINVATNTLLGTFSSIPGTVLAVSPSGTRVVTNDAANTRVLVTDISTSAATPAANTTFLPNVSPTAAAFSPDSFKLFVSASGKVLEVVGQSPHTTALTGNVPAIAMIPQGTAAIAAVAPAGSQTLQPIATCNNAPLTASAISSLPSFLQATPDGTRLIGLGTNWLDVPYAASNPSVCPPTVTVNAGTTAAFSGPAATQLTVSPSGNFAVAASSGTTAVSNATLYNLQTQAPVSVPLLTGTTATTGILTSAGVTSDGGTLFVGVKASGAGTTNAVHRIDLTAATPADAAQINTTFAPEFVAVKP